MRREIMGLALGIGLAGVSWAAAVSGSISGRVLNKADGAPVPEALCKLGAQEAKADAKGRFTFEGLEPGRVKITCSKAGLVDGSGSVTVRAGQRAQLRVHIGEGSVGNAGVAGGATLRGYGIGSGYGRGAGVIVGHGAGGLGTRGVGTGGGGGVGFGRVHGMGPIDTGGGASRAYVVRSRGAIVTRSASGAVANPFDASGAPAADREGYERVGENSYRATLDQPLSTLSIDVDTAAYSNTRRFIDQGRLPPADVARIEDFVNYFSYDYPDPDGPHPFSIATEISVAPWNPAHRLVHLGLQAKKIARDDLPRSNLVFLLDVSGSMASPDKLPLLKTAFRLLINNLDPADRVAIVVYAGAAGLVLPSTEVRNAGAILAAIDNLSAGGSTAGGAGIELAYRIAHENFVKGGNNRVILATDGDFNVGVSDDGGLERLIEAKRAGGVFLTVLGFGQGNYQAAKMEKLADRGNGNFAYIDSVLEAQKVLVREMGGTLVTVAKDVKFQVEFNPAKVKAWRLLGYENRVLAARDFNDDRKDAGELGAGHTVTVLYELIPAGSDEAVGGVDPLKYQAVAAAPAAAGSSELMTVKLRYKPPAADESVLITHPLTDTETPLAQTSEDFRFSSAAAELAMLLRGDEHRGDASYAAVAARAKGALGADPHGDRFEFYRLVEKARLLAEAQAVR